MAETISKVLSAIHLSNELGVLILIGLALITMLYKTLGAAVFAPLLDHLEQRESATIGARFSAGQMRSKAEALNARFQESLLQARINGNKERLKLLGTAREEATAIIAKAEADAARKIQDAREKLAGQVAAATTAAEGEAAQLADLLATRVDQELSA